MTEINTLLNNILLNFTKRLNNFGVTAYGGYIL